MSYREETRDTPLQDAVLEFLRDWKADPQNDGNSPAYDDIGKKLGKHRANIRIAVLALVARGEVQINHRGKISLKGKYTLPE